ncbi:SRPBCC family protein [Methyloligella sp. 2.7D]|uniref:SRPBCC family protein n=1 Tax=unclassified Methyloligella TaxID=2625955 RepID=UPI00157C541D|nr:SRPBCC family protein [Methyloligella sp. GL2]QKP78064.1 SRPBCC family protein [Methyloligella sp. GL2]
MKRLTPYLLIAFVLGIAAPAAAHGPTPKKVEETITIDAAPDEVWAVAKDFAGIKDWHPGVTEVTSKGGNEVDAERTLTLENGGTLIDSLDEYLDDEMSYSYRLENEDIEHFPVSFYSATFSLKPADGGKTTVDWMGRFYRADTGNFPSENQNDEAAIAAMTAYFQQGLGGLKAEVEGQ